MFLCFSFRTYLHQQSWSLIVVLVCVLVKKGFMDRNYNAPLCVTLDNGVHHVLWKRMYFIPFFPVTLLVIAWNTLLSGIIGVCVVVFVQNGQLQQRLDCVQRDFIVFNREK